jgi:hypothetical protein
MQGTHADRLLRKYRLIGAVLDTNLAILLVVGFYNVERIGTFKRTLKYLLSDYVTLVNVVSRIERLVFTPNIATEVDNLIRQLPASEHQAIAAL